MAATEKKYALIKREESLKIFLGVVLKKILGQSKKPRKLVIPSVTSAEEVTFHSLIEESNGSQASPVSTAEEFISLVKEKDIRGKGGAAFSVANKLEAILASNVSSKILIINGVECDPGLCHDKWIIDNRLSEIVQAAQEMKNIFGLERVILASKSAVSCEALDTVQIEDSYPAGAEKILIKNILGRSFSSGEIPAEQGVLVQNVQTLYTLFNMLFKPSDIDNHFLTFTDFKSAKSSVVQCKIGVPVAEIVQKISPAGKDISVGGGVMMTSPMQEGDIADCTVNFIAVNGPKPHEEAHCVGCNQCIAYCPAEIDVKSAFAFLRGKGKKAIGKDELKKCISCGSCTYVCPKNLDLCNTIASKN